MGLANNLAKETLEERLRRSGMNGMLAFASAVSVAFLTALLGIVSYVYQKRTERFGPCTQGHIGVPQVGVDGRHR